ncbi:MAG: insulinase family protein, partial [Spirochaetaceae bacterium]|nr:insulinase family protein [Spirochaetaceae bacterium]
MDHVMTKGDFYRDFEVIDTFRSRDFKGEARLLCHKPSGLQLFHIHNKDEENFFSITFNTPSENSCGTAHILEHSVLCGSKNFPSKTLFADLASQTTNTFLNAMTYRDHTSFAAGSLIKKDFFTLFKVYSDAVFFPLLQPEIFLQEAHRFEMNSRGEVAVNGVVYSEMQGEYSDFEGVMTEKLLTEFFENNHYGFDSGGDPKEIPKLTHEKLRDFHRRHYTVNNCIIFVYGDIPTEQHLDFIHENILSLGEKGGEAFPLKEKASTIRSPKTVFMTGPSSEEEATAAISFKIDTGVKAETFHSLSLLYKLLFDTDASLLKKALIDGGFGSDFSPISETQTLNRFLIATFAMRGISEENFSKYTDFVMEKLAEIAENPIPREAISIVINEWEFSLRELSAKPRPVVLFNRALSSLLYSENPFEFLQTKKIFNRIKRKIKNDPEFFQKLIKKYFLKNSSVIKFFAQGSKDFDEEYRNCEKSFCENCNLSSEEITIQDKNLKIFQEKHNFISIPHLELEDLPTKFPFEYGKR